MDGYISTGEARKRLGCTTQTIRNLIKAGKVEAVRLDNGRFLVEEESLQVYQQNHAKKALVAKEAKQSPSNLPIAHPKSAEFASTRLAKEIANQCGVRPGWGDLYLALLHSELNLDDYTLNCLYKTPEGKIECFHSMLVYALPDDILLFEDELFIDWEWYNLEAHKARYYAEGEFRWWLQLVHKDKVIVRSKDGRADIAGLWNWVDSLEKYEQEREKWLKRRREVEEQADKMGLAICGGIAGLLLLIGLVNR